MYATLTTAIALLCLACGAARAQNGWFALDDTLRGRIVSAMATDSTGAVYALAYAHPVEKYAVYNLYQLSDRRGPWRAIDTANLAPEPLVVSPAGSIFANYAAISTWPTGTTADLYLTYRPVDSVAWTTISGGYSCHDFSRPWLQIAGATAYGIQSLHGGFVLASRDGGRVWRTSTLPAAPQAAVVLPDGTALIAAADADDTGPHNVALYRSLDSGATWTAILDSFLVSRFTATPAGALLAVGRDLHRASAGGISGLFGLHRSTDGGASWTRVIDTFEMRTTISRGGVLIGQGTSGSGRIGRYRSVDDGATWQPMQRVTILPLVIPASGRVLGYDYLTTAIYGSDDGENWYEVAPAPPYPFAEAAFAVDRDGYLYLGTGGHGVYRTSASTTSAPDEEATPCGDLRIE